MMRERMIAVLYLLIRDYVPAGEVIKVVNDIKTLKEFKFTNPHLQALAADLVHRLEDKDALIPYDAQRTQASP